MTEELYPVEDEIEVGQTEGARLLANEARPTLRSAGFDDEEIRLLADEYVLEHGSESVDDFVGWVRAKATAGG